ncbi:helix-turn-helix domain-containing protein [Streptomyces sp. NPDC047971]|uniref:helix-turn-helix domain-containing protein n=1 Tax=Streptomyces sp. NPDC047971 TaxID=3154499 RepID=UPI0034100A2D
MGGQHPPVTDEDRQRVRELHAQGLGRNEIARQIGRGQRTVSVLADEMGLSFDRTATAVATEARKADAEARKARILEGLYEVAEDELDYLRRSGSYDMVEVSAGKAVRYRADRLPAQDRRSLMGNISNAITSAHKLEAAAGDPGISAATSLLTSLGNAFLEAAGPPEDDTGEE